MPQDLLGLRRKEVPSGPRESAGPACGGDGSGEGGREEMDASLQPARGAGRVGTGRVRTMKLRYESPPRVMVSSRICGGRPAAPHRPDRTPPSRHRTGARPPPRAGRAAASCRGNPCRERPCALKPCTRSPSRPRTRPVLPATLCLVRAPPLQTRLRSLTGSTGICLH